MSVLAVEIAGFAGELIGPADPGYDEARRLYNGAVDKRPALIARCRSSADVQLALAHARAHGLPVAVRGGGHSIPRFSSCDGGLVIDTGPIQHAEIDTARRTGRFGAGLNWGEFDAATQAHGLAITGGRVTHTGIAGLTLGSGSGWLERKCGITCDSLISAHVVTADGRLLRASTEENHDLFWGLKGGGGNFGIVTEFEFRLQPIGLIVYAGMILHPRAVARDLLRFYRDFMDGAPDEMCGGVSLLIAPPDPALPEAARGQAAIGVIMLYAGDPEAGADAFRPLLEWGEPWLRMVEPMPYVAVQQFVDDAHPWGISEYSKSDYLPQLTDEAIDEIVTRAASVRSPFTAVHFVALHGALDRTDRSTMALQASDAGWYYMYEALWMDPADADHETAVARQFQTALGPWAVDKAPPNFISADEGLARLRASYGEDKFGQLVALKRKFDPENVFSLNQNIPPDAI